MDSTYAPKITAHNSTGHPKYDKKGSEPFCDCVQRDRVTVATKSTRAILTDDKPAATPHEYVAITSRGERGKKKVASKTQEQASATICGAQGAYGEHAGSTALSSALQAQTNIPPPNQLDTDMSQHRPEPAPPGPARQPDLAEWQVHLSAN